MFCRKCGYEVQEDWAVCPNCGCEILKKMERENVVISEAKEYNLIGMRRTGRFSFWRIPSTIKVDGENIHLITKGKKTTESQFKKMEISSIDFPIMPIWKISDYVRLAVFGILMAFTKGLSFFAVLFFIKIVMSRHLRLKLSTGQVIKIPICQKADVSGFLRDLKYSEAEIAKNESQKLTDKQWTFREWIISMIFFVVAAGTLYTGFEMESDSRQKDTSTDHAEEIESYSDDKQEDDIGDLAMYLVNGNGVLPVQVENVYLSSYYSGFLTVSFDMVNISDVDISEATFGFVAWDSNMLPLKLTKMYEVDSSYFHRGKGHNIAVGQTMEASITFEEKDIKYMQILLLEYSDFEGNIWTNPAASYYENNFAGKKLDKNTMTAMVFEEEATE